VAEASDNRQPLSKNQLGIAVLVLVVVIAVAVGLYFLLKSSPKKHAGANGGTYKVVTARILTASELKSEALVLGQQFYWAGPKPGYSYEFRRTVNGYIFVRYLPNGLHAGAIGDFLDIASYPFTQALNGTKNQAKAAGATVVNGHGGSVIYVDPKRPRTVYMAFPGVNVQIEIFGQSPVEAVTLARSRKIRLAH